MYTIPLKVLLPDFPLDVPIRIDKNLFFGEVNIQKREFCVKEVSALSIQDPACSTDFCTFCLKSRVARDAPQRRSLLLAQSGEQPVRFLLTELLDYYFLVTGEEPGAAEGEGDPNSNIMEKCKN